MKLSYAWLKKYIDLKSSPARVAELLTMSGSEVEEVKKVGSDSVMSMEITSNRPDCLNIIGLAREVAAVTAAKLRLPDMKAPRNTGKGPEIKCAIKNKKLCPRYTARVITDTHITATAGEMTEKILALGMRAVNGVVDVTNFCLMETGQPMHAFDLDKIKGNRIIVREAVKGEKITTIDGTQRELAPGMLVIADDARPIAIAGIMGGVDTEVTGATKNILLESAYFDPASIRRTARLLGLSSESGYRFERGVDKDMVKPASDRAARLIGDETGGRICAFYDTGKLSAKKTSVKLDVEKAAEILGVPLRKDKVKSLFRRLGMTVTIAKSGSMSVSVPSFREDITQEVDLVEEIARVQGYDSMPMTMANFIPETGRKTHDRRVAEKLKDMLCGLGLSEIMTYSLISRPDAERFPDTTVGVPIGLKNPLSEEHAVLTPHLLDGMLRTIAWNLNRKNTDLALFEIGKIYMREGEGKKISEIPALCVGMTGVLRRDWREGKKQADLYDLKGAVEMFLKRLKIPVTFHEAALSGMETCAGVKLFEQTEDAGFLGTAGADMLNAYDIGQPVFVCQLRLDKIMKKAVLLSRYRAVPRFPSSSRDISVLCEADLPAGKIREVIRSVGEDIIQEIELVDVYKGKQVPSGKKSLSFSITYGLGMRTLTDKEIESVHTRIKTALTEKFNVAFR